MLSKDEKKLPWPDQVPILDVSDICIGPYEEVGGCGCLMKWTDDVAFGPEHYRNKRESHSIRLIIRETLDKVLGFHITYYDSTHTKRKIVEGWNKAMKELGYTQPCDREE